MTKNENVSDLFGDFWLEPQVLPQGYFIVNSITGKIDSRPARGVNATPPHRFDCWSALTQATKFADPSYAEGYAELSLAVTKAVVEVYQNSNGEESESAAAAAVGGGGGGAIDEEEASTPPFFPLLRAYLNDKAVYQSKIGEISAPLNRKTGFDAPPGLNARSETPVSTAPGSPSHPLMLASIHEVDFNEELKLSIHTPASLLTLQLFEKDFCADISLSEILLASATIPIHILQPGKNLDLVISVHCTLPQYYSLQALTGQTSKLQIHEPVAIIARLYVTLALAVPRGGWSLVFREIAALSLPRGPWTPQAIVDPSEEDDELVAITGCDIFSVINQKGVLSIANILQSIASLIFALTGGFDDLGSESVVIHLKNIENRSVELCQEERMRMTYVAMLEDLMTLVEHLVVGPMARTSHFVYDVTHFRRPIATLGILLLVWLPLLTPFSSFLYSIIFIWLGLFFVTEVSIATKPGAEANNKFGSLLAKLQQIQGAEMLIRPIEQSINAATMRRLRIIELWLKALKTRVVADAAKTEHFQKSMSRFIQNPWRIVAICVLAYSSKARILAGLCLAFVGTLVFTRHIPAVSAVFSFSRGLSRYTQLRAARFNNPLKSST